MNCLIANLPNLAAFHRCRFLSLGVVNLIWQLIINGVIARVNQISYCLKLTELQSTRSNLRRVSLVRVGTLFKYLAFASSVWCTSKTRPVDIRALLGKIVMTRGLCASLRVG